MIDLNAAGELIERFALQYQQMQALSDALKEIGSIENAKAEAIRARVQAEADRDAALIDLSKAKSGAKYAKDKAAAIIGDAESKAAAILADAEGRASQVSIDAQSRADDLIAMARTQASNILADAGNQVATSAQAMNDAIARRDAVLAEIADAEDRAAKAQKQLDALRARLAAIVGD